MSIILKNNETLSFIFKKNKKFIVGFESDRHARHVHYNINPIKPNFRLKLNREINLEDHIYIGKRVMMDLNATLILDKKNEKQRTYQRDLANELSYMMTLNKMNIDDFVSTPLISETNIILLKSKKDENINSVSFNGIAIYTNHETVSEIRMRLENTI